jgi:hypothetical protein
MAPARRFFERRRPARRPEHPIPEPDGGKNKANPTPPILELLAVGLAMACPTTYASRGREGDHTPRAAPSILIEDCCFNDPHRLRYIASALVRAPMHGVAWPTGRRHGVEIYPTGRPAAAGR